MYIQFAMSNILRVFGFKGGPSSHFKARATLERLPRNDASGIDRGVADKKVGPARV